MGSASEAFTSIYRDRSWGGTSRSGPGSDPRRLRPYLKLVTAFIRDNNVRSVVDIGCGDWAFARRIDWSGVDYTGIDVVPELVDRLNETFGQDEIRFLCADLVSSPLPSADLCIIKDVLQHLPNESVQRFLASLPKCFKHAIITNDMSREKRGGWWKLLQRFEIMTANRDTFTGGYRPLRLTDDPFRLPAVRLALIPIRIKYLLHGPWGTIFDTKEVLLWNRDGNL